LWAHFFLPRDTEESEDTFLPSKSHKIIGSADPKNAIVDVADIGKFVAEIINDDRTLNRCVFCYGEELTQKELWEVARKAKEAVSGGARLEASPKYESDEVVLEKVKAAEVSSEPFAHVGAEYLLSIYIRGDNTVENAKKAEYGGALDARELYPNLKVTTIEEVAKALYRQS